MSQLAMAKRTVASIVGLAATVLLVVPAAEAQTPCGTQTTVRPGDAMAQIARRCGTTLPALIAANPQIANPNVIRPGMTVRMPVAALPAPPPIAAPTAPASAQVGRYIVRPGDTLFAIARRHGVSVSALLRANPHIHPRLLRVGTVVRIPGMPPTPPVAGPRRPVPLPPIAMPPRRGPGDVPSPVPMPLVVVGTLTAEGATCPAMRGDDGRLYTLAGEMGGLQPGQRVQVAGRVAEASICMQGTTITVDRIRRIG